MEKQPTGKADSVASLCSPVVGQVAFTLFGDTDPSYQREKPYLLHHRMTRMEEVDNDKIPVT